MMEMKSVSVPVRTSTYQYVPVRTSTYQYVLCFSELCSFGNLTSSYRIPWQRSCAWLFLKIKTLPGCVSKLHVLSKVRPGTYRYVLPCTKVKFVYCHVLVRTCTYRYILVRTILPDLVKVYRISDAIFSKNSK
jgi:hypothetical protein